MINTGKIGLGTTSPMVSIDINATDALKLPSGNDIIIENKSYIVTVVNTDNGEKYFIDGLENPELTFNKG